jgi:hypothetical protein
MKNDTRCSGRHRCHVRNPLRFSCAVWRRRRSHVRRNISLETRCFLSHPHEWFSFFQQLLFVILGNTSYVKINLPRVTRAGLVSRKPLTHPRFSDVCRRTLPLYFPPRR